jgi:hypothetical protein
MKRTLLALAALLAALALPAAADTGYRDWKAAQPGPHAAHYGPTHAGEPVPPDTRMDLSQRPFGPTGDGAENTATFRRWLGLPSTIQFTPRSRWYGSEGANTLVPRILHAMWLRGELGAFGVGRDGNPSKEEYTLFAYLATSELRGCAVPEWGTTEPAAPCPPATGAGGDDRCPGGLWHECPPPRLPCDEYFPPSASRPYCYTLAGSAQRLRCSDVPACRPGGQPQPPEPEPPVEPEPEPPGERGICEDVLSIAVALGCGGLSPLPPCAGEWIFTCEVAP